jgi:hypothetical protein
MFRTQGSMKDIHLVNIKEVSSGGNGATPVRCFGSVRLSRYTNILIGLARCIHQTILFFLLCTFI